MAGGYVIQDDAVRVTLVKPSTTGVPNTAEDPTLGNPAANVALVTPNDGADLAGGATRGISFGTAGALSVVTVGGQTVTIPSGALSAGIIHPLRVIRVRSTGTTAANIVAYW